MNDDQHQHTTAVHEGVDRERDGADEAPRERETAAFARHSDPSLMKNDPDAARKERPGVEWVRPTDLMASRSARIAGRGIDFQAELARRSRRVPGHVYRGTRTGVQAGTRFVSERARKLPPVTAFGRGSGERFSWVSRSGIGLG
jgi:hypothetical protein